jgi:aminomethyltransferase
MSSTASSQAAVATRLWPGPWYRKTPYFAATQRYGCKAYDIYNRTYLPAEYDDIEAEYEALTNRVTVWDVGAERQVEISGPDAFAFADLLTPRDLTRCAVGQCKYVLICDQDGGIVNDPVLARLAEDRFWLSVSSSDVLLWAKGVATHAGLDVAICEPDVWPMQVQGPKSKDVIGALFGTDVRDLKYYWFSETHLDDIPVIVTRTGWSGEVGYEIYLRDGRLGDQLWERVMDAGRAYGIKPIAPSEIRRIEAGILNWSSDMTLDNNPYEVGLGWLVDDDKKSDYIGKESLARIKAEGVKRKLVGVEIHGDRLETYLYEYRDVWNTSGDLIGRLSAAIYSPRLRKNIGYVTVPVGYSEAGVELTVSYPSGPRKATVVRMPFFDPAKDVPKS